MSVTIDEILETIVRRVVREELANSVQPTPSPTEEEEPKKEEKKPKTRAKSKKKPAAKKEEPKEEPPVEEDDDMILDDEVEENEEPTDGGGGDVIDLDTFKDAVTEWASDDPTAKTKQVKEVCSKYKGCKNLHTVPEDKRQEVLDALGIDADA